MKCEGGPFTALAAPIAFAALALLASGAETCLVQAAEPLMKMKVEVVIKNHEYKVSGHTFTGVLTQIIVRNEDPVTHGFTSSLFREVPVRLEGQGYLAGKGLHAYRVDPGKVMVLNFTKESAEEGETQRYVFWCDLHPMMKGEMFIVETKGG